MGFPGGSKCENVYLQHRGPSSIPGWRRSPRGGTATQSSTCLQNPTDRGAWWATVRGVAKSQTRLSNYHLLLGPPSDHPNPHSIHLSHRKASYVHLHFSHALSVSPTEQPLKHHRCIPPSNSSTLHPSSLLETTPSAS